MTPGCSECTVCVTAEEHNSGSFTLQMAVDQVIREGATICLGPGIYNVSEPIRVNGAVSLKLRGQGWMTILAHPGSGTSMAISFALGFTMENLTVLCAQGTGGADVTMMNSVAITVRHCCFIQTGGSNNDGVSVNSSRPAMGLGGFLIHTRLEENLFFTRGGVSNLPSPNSDQKIWAESQSAGQSLPLITAGFICQDNTFMCSLAGVLLRQFSVHLEETRISGNDFYLSRLAAIMLTGVVPGGILSGANVDITDNSVSTEGAGVVVGVSNTRVNGNDIHGESAKQTGDGITITNGFSPVPLNHTQLIGNRLQRLNGDGITLLATMNSAMIKQNVVDTVTGGGITMGVGATAEHLSIENNHLLNLGLITAVEATPVEDMKLVIKPMSALSFAAGIRLIHVGNADIAQNVLSDLGVRADREAQLGGIYVTDSKRLRIGANRISNLGPLRGVGSADAILIRSPFGQVDVIDNSVRRNNEDPPEGGDKSAWRALQILEKPGAATSSGIVSVETEDMTVQLNREDVVFSPRMQGAASVRGNTVDYYGSTEAVTIGMAGRCAFNDNRATSLLPTDEPVVILTAGAIIMNANYLIGPENIDAANFNPDVRGGLGKGNGLAAAVLSPLKGPLAVVGNITTAPIVLEGNRMLPVPWQALNVISLSP